MLPTLGYLAAFLLGATVAALACAFRSSRQVKPASDAFERTFGTTPEGLLRAIFDASPAFVFFKDTANRIIRVNRTAAMARGLPPSVLEGRETREFYPEHAEQYFADDQEVARSGAPKIGIIEPIVHADGTKGWVRTDKIPYRHPNGEVKGIIVFSSDVSELKATEHKLEEALEAAKRASRAKSDFLSVVSHEIRTPLGVILGFSELLMSHDVPEKTRLAYTEKIQRNGKRLQKLIDDILDVSRIEQGQIFVEPTTFAVRPLIADLESIFRAKAVAKGLELRVDVAPNTPQSVTSDPNRLRQVVSNVLDNAIKFTTQGSVTMAVRGEPTANGRSRLVVAVTDTGSGVPPGNEDRLFQPFTQLDPASRMKGGVGLGLSLSRRLAQALGGNVELQSTALGAGSTFLVHVDTGAAAEPARDADGAIGIEAGKAPQNGKILDGLTLLLVEDYPDIQDMIRRFVEDTGLKLLSAETGSDGVDLALSRHPDLVLMDLQLPKMDGMRATSILRSRGFKRPIIAMTAHAMKGQQQACLEAGFDDFISKPLSREELLARLKRFAALIR